MSRDWELHCYFDHRPLTAAFMERVLARLADEGLAVAWDGPDRFPALAGLTRAPGGAVRLAHPNPELLLRSAPPPVGAGYGVIPLRTTRSGVPRGVPAFFSLARPDASGIDSVSLAIDAALFQPDEEAGLDAAFAWLIALCELFTPRYAWGDWETAGFLVATPGRREVQSGQIPRLLRFNAVAPSLAGALKLEDALRDAPRRTTLADGTAVFHATRRDHF